MRRFGLAHRDQRGFTLVEMVTVVAIIGLISLGIAMAISQVVVINARASNHMIAVRQVQQAGEQVSEDVLQAQPNEIDDNPGGGRFLVLGWEEPHSDPDSAWYRIEVEYELVPTPDGLAKLRRTYSRYDDDEEPLITQTNTIAQYIDPDPGKTSFAPRNTGFGFAFKITATVGGQSETRVYEVQPRTTPR